MQHKETLEVAGGSHSEGRVGVVPTESGRLAPAPRYKQRKVSAIRDFPPGCGRVVQAVWDFPAPRPRRGATFVRDFPPFCGRNAPLLSEEERMKWLTSLKKKGFSQEESSEETIEVEELSSEEMRKQDAYDMNEDEEDMKSSSMDDMNEEEPSEETREGSVGHVTLHLYRDIRHKLGKNCKRVDTEALRILKEMGKYGNTDKHIIGAVPGVEVGDKFRYFVELNIVGLHSPTMGGIGYVHQDGSIIATSVVASDGYENDLNKPDVLIYMGQGGNIKQKCKQPEDQKLERGNLALANSMKVKNPVRVIRGSSEGRGKTYVYDGLYRVEDYKEELGTHGKLVYKFKLVRIWELCMPPQLLGSKTIERNP